MSYEKQNWATGDIITAAKLNHMEDGIAGGATGVITSSDDFDTIDQSYNDIVAMVEAGLIPHFSSDGVIHYLISTAVVDQTGEGDIIYQAKFKSLVIAYYTTFTADDPSAPMNNNAQDETSDG